MERIDGAFPKRLKTYVLRSGRMSAAQKRLYESDHPCLLRYNGEKLALSRIFPAKKTLTVEIGFGMGLATAQIAEEHPDINYLGLEVHKAGIGRLLWEIDSRALKNVRIIEADAVAVIENGLAPNSVDAFHIFFPDPWPKKRHHKRRLIQRPFTDLLASRLKPGAYLYFVTDWAEYGDWALTELEATRSLVNSYQAFAPRQAWRPQTKFEAKGLSSDRAIQELLFTKAGEES